MKIVTFTDESANPKQEATKLGPHPTLIVVGTTTESSKLANLGHPPPI